MEVRGIEVRQRSTPTFIEDCQRNYLDTLDRHRSPGAVFDRLRRDLRRLGNGDVPAEQLVAKNRTSKPLEAYEQGTLTVSALLRYREHGIEKSPGQDVEYVVVDDGARLPERVRLPFEQIEGYADFYKQELVRAAESVVSPLGWDNQQIREHLRGRTNTSIRSFE